MILNMLAFDLIGRCYNFSNLLFLIILWIFFLLNFWVVISRDTSICIFLIINDGYYCVCIEKRKGRQMSSIRIWAGSMMSFWQAPLSQELTRRHCLWLLLMAFLWKLLRTRSLWYIYMYMIYIIAFILFLVLIN